MIKEFKKFYKQNSLLTWIAIGAFINCGIFLLSYSWQEWWNGAGRLYEFTYELSLAYLGSLIFYIVQVYYVNEKKIKGLKKQMYIYFISIYGEMNTAKESFKNLECSFNGDYEGLKKCGNRVMLNELQNDKEFQQLFILNIKHSITTLDSKLGVIEEYIKILFSMNISSLGSNLEYIDKDLQIWIEGYKQLKVLRLKYHNGNPKDEQVYFKAMFSYLEKLNQIYSEDFVRRELNVVN